jgi:hypothetical protein
MKKKEAEESGAILIMIMLILNQWNGYVLKPSTRNFTLSELHGNDISTYF